MKKNVEKSFPDLKKLEEYIEEIIPIKQQRPTYIRDYIESMTKEFYQLLFPIRDIQTEKYVLENDLEKYDFLIEKFEEIYKEIFQMKTHLNEKTDGPTREKMLKSCEKITKNLKTKRDHITELLNYDISKERLKEVRESNRYSKIAFRVSIGSFIVAIISITVAIISVLI